MDLKETISLSCWLENVLLSSCCCVFVFVCVCVVCTCLLYRVGGFVDLVIVSSGHVRKTHWKYIRPPCLGRRECFLSFIFACNRNNKQDNKGRAVCGIPHLNLDLSTPPPPKKIQTNVSIITSYARSLVVYLKTIFFHMFALWFARPNTSKNTSTQDSGDKSLSRQHEHARDNHILMTCGSQQMAPILSIILLGWCHNTNQKSLRAPKFMMFVKPRKNKICQVELKQLKPDCTKYACLCTETHTNAQMYRRAHTHTHTCMHACTHARAHTQTHRRVWWHGARTPSDSPRNSIDSFRQVKCGFGGFLQNTPSFPRLGFILLEVLNASHPVEKQCILSTLPAHMQGGGGSRGRWKPLGPRTQKQKIVCDKTLLWRLGKAKNSKSVSDIYQ